MHTVDIAVEACLCVCEHACRYGYAIMQSSVYHGVCVSLVFLLLDVTKEKFRQKLRKINIKVLGLHLYYPHQVISQGDWCCEYLKDTLL